MLGFDSPSPPPPGGGGGGGGGDAGGGASSVKGTNLLSERDSAFEEAVVAREFQGIHYYE